MNLQRRLHHLIRNRLHQTRCCICRLPWRPLLLLSCAINHWWILLHFLPGLGKIHSSRMFCHRAGAKASRMKDPGSEMLESTCLEDEKKEDHKDKVKTPMDKYIDTNGFVQPPRWRTEQPSGFQTTTGADCPKQPSGSRTTAGAAHPNNNQPDVARRHFYPGRVLRIKFQRTIVPATVWLSSSRLFLRSVWLASSGNLLHPATVLHEALLLRCYMQATGMTKRSASVDRRLA